MSDVSMRSRFPSNDRRIELVKRQILTLQVRVTVGFLRASTDAQVARDLFSFSRKVCGHGVLFVVFAVKKWTSEVMLVPLMEGWRWNTVEFWLRGTGLRSFECLF